MAGPFEYLQARELAEAFAAHGARYLFLEEGAAILLGFPDTTQATDVFVEKSRENGRAVLAALKALGFDLTAAQQEEILRGKDFVQLRSGPFDVDLIFAPDGIESFRDAEARAVTVEGIRVCSIDDIIRSKEAAGRVKDRETLPRLIAFRDWLGRAKG